MNRKKYGIIIFTLIVIVMIISYRQISLKDQYKNQVTNCIMSITPNKTDGIEEKADNYQRKFRKYLRYTEIINCSPLACAIMDDQQALAIYLIIKIAPINDKIDGFLITEIFGDFVNRESSKKVKFNLTPLHLAAIKGQTYVAEALISKGADVNAKDWHSMTPIFYAIISGNNETVKILIKKGSKINIKDKDGCTPLHYSAEAGNAKLISSLISSGCNVNAKNRQGKTPLHYAAKNGSIATIRELIKYGANINEIDNEDDKATPLIEALYSQKDKAALFLIRKGADPLIHEGSGISALHLAVEIGNTELIELIIKKGENVNITDYGTALHCAKSANVISLLLKYGADVNIKDENGETPICRAVERNDLKRLKFLIKSGAKVNTRNINGETPLHLAARYIWLPAYKSNYRISYGDPKISEILIINGNDVNSKDNYGKTPLHAAAENGNIDIMKLLIFKGAYINIKDKSGNTPLDYAKSKAAKELLLKYKASKAQ